MLRSQDVRTQGDPTSLDGTIARIDPDTGNAPADNPMKDFAGADSNTKRIVATGFRNPFRMTFRPGHSDLYVGDVGNEHLGGGRPVHDVGQHADQHPELRLALLRGCRASAGSSRTSAPTCAPASMTQGATDPLYKYTHIGTLTPKGPCFPGSADQTSSISGLAFYEGASGASIDYPSKYDGALFFVDYSRDCLGAILPQASGIPDPGQVEQVASGIANPVDIVTGPGGDLYYVDHNGGRVVRIKYVNAPIARATANPDGGQAPDLDPPRRLDVNRSRSRLRHRRLGLGLLQRRQLRRLGPAGGLADRHPRSVPGQAAGPQHERPHRHGDAPRSTPHNSGACPRDRRTRPCDDPTRRAGRSATRSASAAPRRTPRTGPWRRAVRLGA